VPAHADDPNTLADKLARIQEQQAQQHQHLSVLQQQQAQVQQQLGTLQAQLAQSNADLAPVASQIQTLQSRMAEAATQLARDQGAYTQHLGAFRSDVRKIYELGGMRWFEFILSARSFDDLLNRTIYLQQMTVGEFQVARKLKAERETLEAERRLLAQQEAALTPLLAALQARADVVASQVATVASYDSQLDGMRRQAVIRLAGLQGQSRALQAALDRYQAEAAQAALKSGGTAYAASCPAPAPAGSVRFCGHGWGHGVGLGQWGAKGMALAGLNYRFIDQHFYIGASWAGLDTAHTPIHVAVLWGTATYRAIPSGPAQLSSGGRTVNIAAGPDGQLQRGRGRAEAGAQLGRHAHCRLRSVRSLPPLPRDHRCPAERRPHLHHQRAPDRGLPARAGRGAALMAAGGDQGADRGRPLLRADPPGQHRPL